MATAKRKAAPLDKTAAVRAMAQRSLLAYVWAHNPNFKTPRHIKALIEVLEAVERGEVLRLQIFMPPQNGKSTICSEYFIAWYLGKHPEHNIAYGTYASDFATARGRTIRNLLDSQVHLAIFPNGGLSHDSTAADEFALAEGGKFKAVGRGKGLTGYAVNGIVIDDPFKDQEEADSPTIRQAAKDWFNGVVGTRLKPKDFLIIVNTRWHVDDLSGYTLKEHAAENWKVLKFPAIQPDGTALWPEQFPIDFLLRRKSVTPPRQWSALYQQEPIPAEGGLINTGNFQRYQPGVDAYGKFVAPLAGKPELVVMSADTGQKVKELSDPSVVTVWHVYGTKAYLVDVWRKQVEFGALKQSVKDLAALHRPDLILIEDKASGIQLLQELKDEGTLPVVGIEPEGDKALRASRTSVVIFRGDVFIPVDESTPWVKDFELEVAMFPTADHDDQVDAMSQFLDWFMSRTRSLLIWFKSSSVGRSAAQAMRGF